MQIHVLGSAAGGGFPQWNCNCRNCDGLRRGMIRATARTQSSIAVSSDGLHWVLFNTSPDILQQIRAFPALQPARHLRDTAIAAIVLMDSQIDHSTGLLMLREGCPHQVYCTDQVYEDLSTGFPVFCVLQHWNGGLEHRRIATDGDTAFTIDSAPGLRFIPVSLSSKAPPYSPHRHDPHRGDNIGIRVEEIATGRNLFYAPGLGAIDDEILSLMRTADCVLVDGTFWSEDEMARAGVGSKRARDMGHLPQSGDDGMLATLATLQKPRKILIHINNTNPILDEDSDERAVLAAQGVEVAFDGMHIEL
jgi:pyrroloquinoline quinone biosynthesis protein B